ncbi:hypothetical protein BJ546DRAFT_834178, partial [Cryomyces antarcticus]
VTFFRAIVNFVLITAYYLHTDKTMLYLTDAIYCIDKLKDALNSTFNYPKMHSITYYVNKIRRYRCLRHVSTNVFKVAHLHILKQAFPLTNKQNRYPKQLIQHNTC